MAQINLASMVVPEVWQPYIQQAVLDKSPFFQSGILATNSVLQSAANGEGQFVNMPYLGKLKGIAVGGGKGYDGTAIDQIGGLDIGKNVAVKVFSAASFSETDWASKLSGADPIGSITAQLGEFWAAEQQKSLIASVNGALDALKDAGNSHILDNSAKIIDANALIDAKALLGSAGSEITAICMHSAVYYKLAKDNLIQFVAQSEQNIEYPTYLGLRVIIDDSLVANSGVYTSYLFAPGAVGYANIVPNFSLETDRVVDSGTTVLVSRQGWIIHPYGFSYKGSFNPDNASLGTKTNWQVTGDHKAIKIAAIKHKIA